MANKNNDVRNSDIINNVVVLRSVFGKVGMKYYINPAKDPKTQMFPDCVKHVNSQGDLILTDAERNSGKYFVKENEVIIVEDGTTFDLNNEIDKARWESIKNCPLIAPERFAKDKNGDNLIDGTMDVRSKKPRYGVAELYVDRPGLDSTNRVTKKKLVHNAISYILDDDRGYEGHLLRAKLLGKKMENMPASDVEDYLIQIAEKDPQKIISLYTGDDINLRLLFYDAKDKHIIIRKSGVYVYSDSTVLGASDDAVLTWMKSAKNAKTLEMIRRDTYPDLYKEDDGASK
jgi:hypothetical protein